MLRRLDLNAEQRTFVEAYFKDHLMPFVQPVLLVKGKIRPFLNNAALYLAILLRDKSVKKPFNEYGLVKIPSDHLPRFVQLPSAEGEKDLIMLDDIVRHNVSYMFPGYHILDTYSIKLTRDAELYIDDEFSGDLIEKIRQSLAKRHVGPPSRMVYDREMPVSFLDFLKATLELQNSDLLREGRYHNNFDFFKFPDYGMLHLKNQLLPPLPYRPLEDTLDIFGAIRKRDHLLHVPYQSYEPVIRLFEEAARDPYVTHIKIIQYRVARKSRIMEAIMSAVKAGKQVTVFVEVKARFDEEANLEWADRLERAGVRVLYSFPGLKVHSKLALIRRQETDGPALYTYLGTGNFHEDTAKVYSDFGLFTADRRLTSEVARIFAYLETTKPPEADFQHLLVGQFNLRSELLRLIEQEIQYALSGKKAGILLKLNSLQDEEMIQKLYEASRAGVEIKLIIRGICCLKPGLRGTSYRISAISIVDRFLEHARVFVFHNDGNEKIYFSSADWMVRNHRYRIETAFPIYDQRLRQQVKEILSIQWNDNVKARTLDTQMLNTYRRQQSEVPIRSQLETFYYLKRQSDSASPP
jgi:polyphosphate kinase